MLLSSLEHTRLVKRGGKHSMFHQSAGLLELVGSSQPCTHIP